MFLMVALMFEEGNAIKMKDEDQYTLGSVFSDDDVMSTGRSRYC